MITVFKTGRLFNGNEPSEWLVAAGREIKLQCIGSGTATLKGRVSEEAEWATIGLIKLSNFTIASSISDTEVYTADVSALHSVTVEASGFEAVEAVVYNY